MSKTINFNKNVPDRGYWDDTMIYDLIDYPNQSILIFPAGKNSKEPYLTESLNYFNSLRGSHLLICTSDEAYTYPIHKIKNPYIAIWTQTPNNEERERKVSNVDKYIPIGYTPHLKQNLSTLTDVYNHQKNKKFFFSGQATHDDRKRLVEELKKLDQNQVHVSDGFSKGLDKDKYLSEMARAIIAPCPGGAVTPDSFRLYEAMELGCIPFANNFSGAGIHPKFWDSFGNDFPELIYCEWDDFSDKVQYFLDVFPDWNNRVTAGWMRYKSKLYDQLNDTDDITVVVPTSPISSHPDTNILMETIKSIRWHLPSSKIIVTYDGVKEEQKALEGVYKEYIRRSLYKLNTHYKNIYPVIFKEHVHQSGMMKSIMSEINTKYLLYMEHDTPLVTDYNICFRLILADMKSKNMNLVRFHFESHILDVHRKYNLSYQPINGYMPMLQWSQRPHIAKKTYYEKILHKYFDQNTFIEDVMHGVVLNDFEKNNKAGWNEHRIFMFHPEDENNIKRSYHLDGRKGEQKYL